MELKNIFGATPNSTWQVLCEAGVGYYIPPYQREYNWTKGNIDRLFEDIVYGLQSLVNNTESITFLGTLIVIDRATLPKADKAQLPGNVRLVIDGQQRLTSIVLINVNLHDEIRRRRSNLKVEEEVFKWLNHKAIEAEKRLQKTFEQDMDWGEDEYQLYPRIVRAYEDRWSRIKEEAKYESPIAAFVHGYLKHFNSDNSKELYKGENGPIDRTNNVLTNYGVIRGKIRELLKSDEKNKDIMMLPFKHAAEKSEFQDAILNAEFPEYVRSILLDEENIDFKQLLALILFANFLMDRVTVTVVSAYNEDYAFDMFESLNTTGTPLTAFETFKPKVIETVSLSEYKGSISQKLIKPIEDYLGKFNKAEDRHTETSRFLIPFALAETGKQLPKRHSDQRAYLRSQYDMENVPANRQTEERHKFLEHMSHTALFIEDTWKKEDKAFESMTFSNKKIKDVLLMCMDLLGKVNHEITIGSLVRFYSHVRLTTSDTQEAAVSELEKAIKTVTAFFAFWRGSGKTTGELAKQYRELMEKGITQLGNQAFCRRPDNGKPLVVLPSDRLQEALRYVLNTEGKINCKEDWITLSFEEPVYKDRKTLTRFLLFAAMHNSTEDSQDSGLREAGREGRLNMFSWEKWDEDLEIEHVVPQEKPDQSNLEEDQSKEGDLYGNPNLIDSLGNLTLLPKAENASLKNKRWEVKKEIYYIISAPSQEEQKSRLAEVRKRKVVVPDTTEELILEGKYYEHLSAIYKVSNWNVEFVQKRSKRLAELIWTNIAPWLGLDDE